MALAVARGGTSRTNGRMLEWVLLLIPMLLAFGFGYWVRDVISRRRRAEARRIFSVDAD
jgi:hypothetical protein